MNQHIQQEPQLKKKRQESTSSPSRSNHRKIRPEKSKIPMLFLIAFGVSGIGIGTGVYYWSQSPVDEINLPVIMEAKEDACIKVRPGATDNAPLPYSNISIYSELEEHSKEPVVEQLLPEPEKPIIEAQKETPDTPVVEVAQLEASAPEEPALSQNTTEIRISQNQSSSPTPTVPPKARESLNDAVHKTLRTIYNDAAHMIVENVSHGKQMPTLEQPNSNLKIVSQKKQIKQEPAPATKEIPKAINTVVTTKTSTPELPSQEKPVGILYWVEFKPQPSSKDAEHIWHQVATHKSVKALLTGISHKIQRQSAEDGNVRYHLSVGPFTKESAFACCQQLRQAKVNCRVIKK